MTAAESERYHGHQIETLADAGADLVSGLTLTYAAEAIGIVRAASSVEIPPVVSFTVETDGRLPSGQPLADAGLRANASRKSHAELDEAEELDDGDPVELGEEYGSLRSRLPRLQVLGGCCGTDHRHVAEIAACWLAG